jgi:hypothetical protein
MTVPYTFSTATGNVPLAELDANFASVANNVSSANTALTALTAGTVTTNAQPNIRSVGTLTSLSVTGNVTANLFVGTISGSVANAGYATTAGFATTAGTVITAAQPNITSIGTLTSLSVAGNINAGNVIATNLSGPVFMANVLTGQGIPTSPSGISQLPLMYDSISANISGGYAVGNSVIGSTFTAPDSGFYQVSAAIGVTPSNWATVTSYSSVGAISLYKNNNPVASGPPIDFIGLTIGNVVLQITTSSSISTLVELDEGDTIECKLIYLTTAPTNFWNTSTNAIQGYFQACWVRGS